MTPEREQEIRQWRSWRVENARQIVRDLLAALDAERVRCADLERERDEALTELHGARWAMGFEHHKGEEESGGLIQRLTEAERERDGWKARAEQWRAQALSELKLSAIRHARVTALERALTESKKAVYLTATGVLGIEQEACKRFVRTRNAVLAAGRPGSGAPAECPHCRVELVDGTCVAGCYYRAPETQEDAP